jgi:LytR cell envelope-related transcriptional attenuator
MDGLETRGTNPPSGPELDPPRGDEGLDDWFARRLAAQGILSRRVGFPISRVVAVAALAVAVGLALWVMSGLGSSSTAAKTSSAPSGSSAHTTPGPSTGKKKKHNPAVLWNHVPLTVYNGYSATIPSAGSTQALLKQHGWSVFAISDTSPQNPALVTSYVVYPAGKLAAAKVVAARLHLKPPVAVASAPGVPSTLTTVAIVLGSSLLPALGG